MIEIHEPPDIRACAACQRPISWLYSARTRTWVAFAHDRDDRLALRVHTCKLLGQPDRTPWRYLEPVQPEIRQAGVRRARAVLAAKAKAAPTGDN